MKKRLILGLVILVAISFGLCREAGASDPLEPVSTIINAGVPEGERLGDPEVIEVAASTTSKAHILYTPKGEAWPQYNKYFGSVAAAEDFIDEHKDEIAPLNVFFDSRDIEPHSPVEITSNGEGEVIFVSIIKHEGFDIRESVTLKWDKGSE